jgi:hypothetical protein
MHERPKPAGWIKDGQLECVRPLAVACATLRTSILFMRSIKTDFSRTLSDLHLKLIVGFLEDIVATFVFRNIPDAGSESGKSASVAVDRLPRNHHPARIAAFSADTETFAPILYLTPTMDWTRIWPIKMRCRKSLLSHFQQGFSRVGAVPQPSRERQMQRQRGKKKIPVNGKPFLFTGILY